METRFLAVGASVVALTEASAYASDDDGASWRTLVLPAGAGKIRKVVESGDRWLALSERAHLYESADAGRRWRRFGAALSRRFAPDEARLESWSDLACRGDEVYIVTTTQVIRTDRSGGLQRAWTLPPRDYPAPTTARERIEDRLVQQQGWHRERLVDVDLDPAAGLDLVRSSPFGLYAIPARGEQLAPYGPSGPLPRGVGGIVQLVRARGRVLVATGTGLELDGVAISTEHLDRAREAVAQLDPALPAWLRGLAYTCRAMVRDLTASPWSDRDWLVADNDGVEVTDGTRRRRIWSEDVLADDELGLISRMTVVGSAVWFGFHRARPDVAGIVLRDGGRRAATVTLPVSPAARSA